MPRVKPGKHTSSARAAPYDGGATKGKVANNIFKFNKDVGQHILKNPGIAQAIVDKADLKQSDVRNQAKIAPEAGVTHGCRLCSK